MISALTTKFEIDVLPNAHDLDKACLLAVSHVCPAIVVPPQLASQAILNRSRRNGQFKVILAIDWATGQSYGMLKMRGFTAEMIGVDGYEIMLTGNKYRAETKNEADSLTKFIKNYISELTEVRFVLGTTSRPADEIEQICGALNEVRAPALIRTDIITKGHVSKASVAVHKAELDLIRGVTSLPVKVSGNIESFKHADALMEHPNKPDRFAVTAQQFISVITEMAKRAG